MWEFLEHGKTSIFNFQVWTGLSNLGKYQNRRGPPVSCPVRTTAPPVPTVSGPRLPPHRPPYPPLMMSSPFWPSSSVHTQPLLLLASCRRRPPHPGPPSTAPSSHPSAQPSPPRAPPHAGAPLRPFQLRPRIAAPPRSTRATMEPPSPVRFPSLWTPNQTPREPGTVLGYIPRLPVPPVHRIPIGAAAVRHELSPPLFPATGRKARWAKITTGPQRFGPL
jgi:hypothetical protein